jgi:hypothetical protein
MLKFSGEKKKKFKSPKTKNESSYEIIQEYSICENGVFKMK